MLEFDMMKMLAFVSIQGLEQKFVVPVPSDSLNCHGQKIHPCYMASLNEMKCLTKKGKKDFEKINLCKFSPKQFVRKNEERRMLFGQYLFTPFLKNCAIPGLYFLFVLTLWLIVNKITDDWI